MTSGTLSPIEGYEMQLGLKFEQKLENEHVIDMENQVVVRVASAGLANKPIKCTYDRREIQEQYTEVGNSIAAACKNIPGGVIVFFTSYSNLENFVSRWGGPDVSYQGNRGRGDFFKAKSTNPDGVHVHQRRAGVSSSSATPPTSWDRLLAAKNVVIEPRSPPVLAHCMDRFNNFVKTSPHGCLLLSVCRGRLSEGYDFSDGLCRGVIVVGLPFVNVSDVRVKLKRSYMDERCATLRKCAAQQKNKSEEGGSGLASDAITGSQWYQQSAFRAVNQALGRLIRHKDDYGAVILMDSRFESEQNRAGISKWIRGQIKVEKYGKILYDISKFFKGVRGNSRLVSVAPPGNIKWSKGGCDWDELGRKVERSRQAVMAEERLRREEEGTRVEGEYVDESGVVIAGEEERQGGFVRGAVGGGQVGGGQGGGEKRKLGIGMGGAVVGMERERDDGGASRLSMMTAPPRDADNADNALFSKNAGFQSLAVKQSKDKLLKSAKVKEFHAHITSKLAGKMDVLRENITKLMGGDSQGVDGVVSVLVNRKGGEADPSKLKQSDVDMVACFVNFVVPHNLRAHGRDRLRPVQVAFARAQEEKARQKDRVLMEWEKPAKKNGEETGGGGGGGKKPTAQATGGSNNPFATTAAFASSNKQGGGGGGGGGFSTKKGSNVNSSNGGSSDNSALSSFITGAMHKAGSTGAALSPPKPSAPRPKQYIPDNVACPVCTEKPTEPLVNGCGHVACRTCWLGWATRLKEQGKEGTCMTCRESIAGLKRIEWKQQPEEGSTN